MGRRHTDRWRAGALQVREISEQDGTFHATPRSPSGHSCRRLSLCSSRAVPRQEAARHLVRFRAQCTHRHQHVCICSSRLTYDGSLLGVIRLLNAVAALSFETVDRTTSRLNMDRNVLTVAVVLVAVAVPSR